MGARDDLTFNIMTEMADNALAEFEAVGGGDPWINSRIRLGVAASELALLDDAQFTHEQDRERSPAFGDWMDRNQIGYSCLSNLVKRDDLVVGAATIRDRRQAPMDSTEKRAFANLACSLRDKIRLQLLIEGQQAKLVAGSFDAIEGHAFVCRSDGVVMGMSSSAERLVQRGRWLSMRGNRLVATDARSAKVLAITLEQAALGTVPDSLVVHDAGGLPLYLELSHFRGSHALSFQAAALIIARPPNRRTQLMESIARAMWRLTPSEALIAAYVAAGNSPQRIAELNGVSTGTVRTHLKRIFDKTGARSQVELAALLTSHL
ncbi:helix-turn-helix transcriptional regulator [Aurantiacibacter hainanensis]|uniref:helix-turn-helix transcriptional regulator n=1 Tax=Aurantiacibacter hainanensis TaxID=3076114 RepID=UPI0030C73F6C